MRILGIDPGLSGALAFWSDGVLDVHDIPTMKARTRGREVDWSEAARIVDIDLVPGLTPADLHAANRAARGELP